MGFVIASYGIIGVVVAGYALYLRNRRKALLRESSRD
jgi:CcmD family protein